MCASVEDSQCGSMMINVVFDGFLYGFVCSDSHLRVIQDAGLGPCPECLARRVILPVVNSLCRRLST